MDRTDGSDGFAAPRHLCAARIGGMKAPIPYGKLVGIFHLSYMQFYNDKEYLPATNKCFFLHCLMEMRFARVHSRHRQSRQIKIERCYPQRLTVFARMVLLKLNQPGTGWWLGHSSEKYESQLG